MGNRLRRTSLLPATAEAPEVDPVTEPYPFASLTADLVARGRGSGTAGKASDLLHRKGSAAATRSRSYDHKDAFEPAQVATAPPSDVEELGSWQKYDSPLPASTDEDEGEEADVSGDERPISWSKYEMKPAASLLDMLEKRRAKMRVALAESVVPQPITLPAAPAAVETTPELVPPTASLVPTPPAVPAAPAAVETAPELVPPTASLVPKPTLVVEMPATEVKLAPAAEIEIGAPAPVADPVVMAGPAAEIAPAVEPTAAPPELPLPEIDSPALATTVAEDDEPEFPTTVAPAPAELERSEPAVPPEYPTLALAPPDEQSPVLAEVTARETLAVATDEPRSDEPVTVSELTKFADRTSDTVQEGPSVASAAPAPASDAAPLPPQEPAAATSALAIKSAIPGKRAMLARLAEMLEQALSATRSQTVDAAPTIVSVDEPASVPESPVAIAPVAAASDLSPVISEEHPAATIDVVEAAAPAADPAAIVEPEVPVAAARETLIELVAPQDDRDHGAEIETGAEASIDAVTPPLAEPEAIDPIVDEPPIEPEALLAASPEPDVELPAPSLDAIEISEPPAVVGVPSSELSAPLEASNEIVAPAVELSRVDEPETGTKSTVAVAAETELSADPIEQPEPRAPQPDLAPEVAEVRKPDSLRKATLARLAEMLQRALSARPASAAVEPRTPPEPTPVIAPSIAENVAPLTEAQMPAAEIPVEPLAMEAPLALAEPPEITELASVADEATVPEPVAASEEPHVGSDFPWSEFTMLEANLSFESVPETPPLDERVHLEEFHELEAAVADEALQHETAATLVLSGEVAGSPADGLDLPEEPAAIAAPPSLENDAGTADAPTEPTLEAVADPALPEMRPEGDDSAIAAESTEAVTLDDVSTPVDETPTQAIATALDAETAQPDEAHESEPVRAPAPALDATSVALEPTALEAEILDALDAPALAASSPMIEAPIIVTAEVSAEHIDDADALLETARPEQAQEVPDPVSVPTPTLDATPVAPEYAGLEPQISSTVAASAPAASEPTIETLEPMIIAAQALAEPIADVAAPLEPLLAEQERAVAEPVPAPPPSSDDAPIAPEFSTQGPESSDAIDLPLLVASSPTIETPEPIVTAAVPTEPVFGALAPVEPAAAEILPAPEAAPAAPTPPRLTPAQQEKAARAALTDDLADVIHNVLSTTHFASRAMKPKRYNEEERQTEEPELTDLGEELAASLPHLVAIPPRFGRMERGIAFVSVAMMIAVGYFAFSLWHGAGSPSAQAAAPRPAIVVAKPHSQDWGERARDMTRELGSTAVVRDASSAQPPGVGANAGARP